MSNNEQGCKHYRDHNLGGKFCSFFSGIRNETVRTKCEGKTTEWECFEPREKRKVKKEVKAWAVVDHAGEIMSFHELPKRAHDVLFIGASVVTLTGYCEVEE